MQSMRDIRRRIKSVQNTQKITRAMKMVYSAKLKRAQERAMGARAFSEKTRTIFQHVAGAVGENVSHPLLTVREGERAAYVVLTSDRGLAGGYNVKILNEVIRHIKDKSQSNLIVLGRKGRDFLARRGFNIISEYLGVEDYPGFPTAQRVAYEVIKLYQSGEVDRVYLCFMKFQSALTQFPTILPLLPIEGVGAEGEEGERREHAEQHENHGETEYIYEPSAEEVLNWILPRYLENILYSALLEAKASEFGARMTAMDSATENAQEMIDKLVLSYNRARQAAITTEISEIVGGAEALK